MAWGSALLAATADAPALITQNICESPVRGRWTVGGGMASTDQGDSQYPVTNAYDRVIDVDTRAFGLTKTWYLNLWTINNLQGGDTIMIAGHNLGGCHLRVQTADSDDFATNLVTMFDLTPAPTTRIVAVLGTSFFNLDRLRLKIDSVADFTPHLSEFFFGGRRVLRRQPSMPWDEAYLSSEISQTRTKMGSITNYGHALGGRKAPLHYTTGDATEIAGLRAAFAETSYGLNPFLFIDRPNSAPTVGYWADFDVKGQAAMLNDGPVERTFDLSWTEVSPYLSQGG